MDTFLFIFFILIAFTLIIGLPILLTIYISRKLRRTRFKKPIFFILAIVIGFIVFEIYVAIYPLDSFYKEDFEYITKVTFPSSANILSKDADYPDIHGHYTSVAVIELSPKDYDQLLKKVNTDITFKVDSLIGENSMFKKVTNGIAQNQIKEIVRKGKIVIGFINDNKRIVLERRLSDNY